MISHRHFSYHHFFFFFFLASSIYLIFSSLLLLYFHIIVFNFIITFRMSVREKLIWIIKQEIFDKKKKKREKFRRKSYKFLYQFCIPMYSSLPRTCILNRIFSFVEKNINFFILLQPGTFCHTTRGFRRIPSNSTRRVINTINAASSWDPFIAIILILFDER